MIINENYDKIDGKYVKNEANYYHYTNLQAFHKIVSSLLAGNGLEGKYYPANTNTYGKLTPKGKTLPNEVCLVRSDRVPDRLKNLFLSGSVGDIKFTFKEEKVVNKFGKIKPIQEYPVQDKKWIMKSIKEARKRLWNAPPVAEKALDTIAAKYHSLSMEEIDKLLKKVELFSLSDKATKELRDDIEEYKDGRPTEHMESRIRLPKGKFITLDLIDKIMIPDYLKEDKEILTDIQRLRSKGFNNIVFYHCKYRKEK